MVNDDCGPSMLPFGLLAVAVAITPRTSSSVMPIDAKRAGSTCTRMAGFCWPPTVTCDTPEICEICCDRMFSA